MNTDNEISTGSGADDDVTRLQRLRSTAKLPPAPRARVADDRRPPLADRLWRRRGWILGGAVVLLALCAGATQLPRPVIEPTLPPQVTVSTYPTPGTGSTPGSSATPGSSTSPTPTPTASATPQPAAAGRDGSDGPSVTESGT